MVGADGSQLVVATNVAQTPTFEAAIAALCDTLGQPETILRDAGYASGEAVTKLEARGIEVLFAVLRLDN